MSAIPALRQNTEEWADADFDIPDDHPIAGNDEDWDVPAIIRPPLKLADDFDDDDEEGLSTIKVNIETLKPTPKPQDININEDFEDGFALPDDLTQLSLAPLSLSHRSSKNSLEAWGEKDHTSSSQSSDAYSTLGLANASPSSNSTTSASLPESETDEDAEEDDMDGLVIPSGMFEKGCGPNHIKKLLELRQKLPLVSEKLTISSPDQEEDFEKDLVIDETVDLSPSRLLIAAQQQQNRHSIFSRSNSMPIQKSNTAYRPPSRLLKSERAKSPTHPPPSRQLQKLRLSPSPPLRSPSAFPSSFQSLSPGPSQVLLPPKASSLRGQRSHAGLKPPTPPSSSRQLRRKASLSSLMETSSQSSIPATGQTKVSRYEEPTAASRARHKPASSRGHNQEHKVPPTRPSTPSSNTAALRLTLPTQSKLSKSRPALASVFGTTAMGSHSRINSPLPPRPPSSTSSRSSRSHAAPPPVPASKVLRRPKRPKTYGDGTELDAFDDLPTNWDQETRFRVQPKQFVNRVPGGSYSSNKADSKDTLQGTLRRMSRRGSSTFASNANIKPPSVNPDAGPRSSPKRRRTTPSNHTKRKPTLIRNLGGSAVEKVVGTMKWNPHILRWEGNDQALREFDAAAGTSTRPALITQLTGSSIGSPASTFASGARVVGNMMFDPSRMCWISTLPAEEEEPDVFANLADDENDESSRDRIPGASRNNAPSDGARSPNSSTSSSSYVHSTRSRAVSTADSDRGSRASLAFDIDEAFISVCRQATARHRLEMKGWRDHSSGRNPRTEPDRTSLYEIRAIARRNYED